MTFWLRLDQTHHEVHQNFARISLRAILTGSTFIRAINNLEMLG